MHNCREVGMQILKESSLFQPKYKFRMKLTGYNSLKSWGIAVACSFVTFVSVLPLKVAGMLFVAFLIRYNTDRQNAAFSLVINSVIASLAGTDKC